MKYIRYLKPTREAVVGREVRLRSQYAHQSLNIMVLHAGLTTTESKGDTIAATI